jgi:ribosomal protein L37AE/L43A
MNTVQPVKGKHFHQFDKEKYDVMTFYPELVWEEIAVSADRKPLHRVWRYAQDSYPCPSCGRPTDVYFMIARTGVFSKCMWCGVTVPCPPFDPEGTEENKAERLSEDVVSYADALDICERIGQSMPTEIPQIFPRNRRVVRKPA